MNQPMDQEDLGSTLRSLNPRVQETDEPDWWTLENELGRKQVRGRAYQGTCAEGTERPRKRGKAHYRRGQSDFSERG